jgi:hypothetical protein
MTNTGAFAERMARADQAFTRHVVDKVDLRTLGPERGVSYDMVRADVAAFRKYLAEDHTSELAERRASFRAELDATTRKALDVSGACMKAGKYPAAVAALNALATIHQANSLTTGRSCERSYGPFYACRGAHRPARSVRIDNSPPLSAPLRALSRASRSDSHHLMLLAYLSGSPR